MKRLTLSLLAALFAAGLTALATPAAAQQRLRIAGNFALDHSSTLAIEQFKKEVEASTKGALIIETFPNMQLGGAQENVSQTRAGTIAMTWVGMAFLSRTVPELEALSLPFMFPNREVAYKVMDGPMGDVINGKLADKGFVALGYMELGPRQVTNNQRPIKTVADLKGLKMRIGGLAGQVLAKLGVIGQQIAGGDIYPALERGTIDAAEWVGPYDDEKLGFNKVAKFYYYPGWWEGGPELSLFINEKKWAELPKHYQAAVEAAAADANMHTLARYDAKNPEALMRLVKGGTQLRPFPRPVMEACEAAAFQLYDELSEKSPHWKRIYPGWKKFRDDQYLWFRVAEYGFDSFAYTPRKK